MLITPGLLTMAALVILILKLRHDTVRKLLGFDIPLDIMATLLFIWMFAGTYAGMMAAIIAGLGFSITLAIMKYFMGCKKLTVIHTKDHFLPCIRWVEVPPGWKRPTGGLWS
jgi:hypothetical protein